MSWKKNGLARAYPCNGKLLTYLRKRHGWTQGEFAQRSGYTERLINKAESGRPISVDTIEDLADALDTPSKPIYPEDLICNPVSVAKEYISALYDHENNAFEAIQHLLDERITFHISGDPDVIPYAGLHQGIPAIKRVFEIFYSIFEAPKNHDFKKCYTFIAQGNRVVVWGESWIHPIGRPMARPIEISHLMKFRRGQLYYLDDCFDTYAGARVILDERNGQE